MPRPLQPQTGAPRAPGRPRGFDMDDVLDKATDVFRKRGYHAASITEISKATGLTEGSIYKAFEDKKALFVAVFNRYCARRQNELHAVLETEVRGAGKLRAALRYYVLSSSGVEGKLGCLIVGSTSALELLDASVAAKVRQALQRNESTLASLIEEGIEDGSLRHDIDPAAVAKLLWCLILGVRVAGKAGAARTSLDIAMEQAMHLLT